MVDEGTWLRFITTFFSEKYLAANALRHREEGLYAAVDAARGGGDVQGAQARVPAVRHGALHAPLRRHLRQGWHSSQRYECRV